MPDASAFINCLSWLDTVWTTAVSAKKYTSQEKQHTEKWYTQQLDVSDSTAVVHGDDNKINFDWLIFSHKLPFHFDCTFLEELWCTISWECFNPLETKQLEHLHPEWASDASWFPIYWQLSTLAPACELVLELVGQLSKQVKSGMLSLDANTWAFSQIIGSPRGKSQLVMSRSTGAPIPPRPGAPKLPTVLLHRNAFRFSLGNIFRSWQSRWQWLFRTDGQRVVFSAWCHTQLILLC